MDAALSGAGAAWVVAPGVDGLEKPFLFVVPAKAGTHSSTQTLAMRHLTSEA